MSLSAKRIGTDAKGRIGRRRIGVWIRLGCLILLLQGSVAAASDPELAVDRLRAATREHPADADLAWALVGKLAETGRHPEALERARIYLARWPDRRPGARIELGRKLLESGASEEALALFDEALEEEPPSGTLRFYRAMALRASGQLEAAGREFTLAGALSPGLRSETLLARALGLFERGQEDQAVSLLQELLRQEPTGETAVRARLLLRQKESLALERAWRLDAYAGFEWDTNVTLESASNETPNTNRKDIRGVWGLGATWKALRGERFSLAVGYRFDQTMLDDLGEFDLLTNTGIVSGSYRASDRFVLRLDGLGWNTRRDQDNELSGGLVRPNLVFMLAPKWGALRAFGQFEIFEYDDEAFFDQLERDGFSVGGGVEHIVPLPMKNAWLTNSLSYQTNRTQADPNGSEDGFDGDYDYDSLRLRARANFRLPAQIDSQLDVIYARDRYHNDNFLELFRSLRVRQREDDSVSAGVQLRRRIAPFTEAEIYWRGTWRESNLEFFDYDQHRVGLLIRFSSEAQ